MTAKSVQGWFTGGGLAAVELLTLAYVVIQTSPKAYMDMDTYGYIFWASQPCQITFLPNLSHLDQNNFQKSRRSIVVIFFYPSSS